MRNGITSFESILASAAFLVAAALAFISLLISPEHEITAGVLMAMAQFLLLTASILHIDYKLNAFGSANHGKESTQGDSK